MQGKNRGCWPSRKELFRSHLATVWLLLGFFLLYATVFFSPHDLSEMFTVGSVVGCFFVLLLFPLCLLLVSLAIITVIFTPKSSLAPRTPQDVLMVCFFFALVGAYLFLWYGVWYIMYERERARGKTITTTATTP